MLRAPISDVLTLGTGNVITRLTKDIDQTVRIIGGIGVRLVVTILMFPFTMVSLALIDWRYLIIFAILATLTVPILRSTLIAMREYSNIVSSAEARRNNLLLDTIRGIPTLRAMRLDKWALGRMQKGSWNAVQANADRAPVITRLIGQATFGYGLLLIATFVVSAMLYDAGELSLGAAAAAHVPCLFLNAGGKFARLGLADALLQRNGQLLQAQDRARRIGGQDRSVPA